jgi:hypothetical protein
MTPVKELL